jgi:hypothetical protein
MCFFFFYTLLLSHESAWMQWLEAGMLPLGQRGRQGGLGLALGAEPAYHALL